MSGREPSQLNVPLQGSVVAKATGRLRGWPMLSLAPVAVALLGLMAALAIVSSGLSELQDSSDAEASLRSKVLAATIASRMRATPRARRAQLLLLLESKTDSGLLLFDQRDGRVVATSQRFKLNSAEARHLMEAGEGAHTTERGRRVRFAVGSVPPPWGHLALLAVVEAAYPAAGTTRMTNAVAVLSLLMLSIAVVVSFVFMRDMQSDVEFVEDRIDDMAVGGATSVADNAAVLQAGALPLRSLDQVAMLTAALNVLIERFARAQEEYRENLTQSAAVDAGRSRFLAGLSHELRTPLNAILGFTHLLESEEGSQLDDEGREAIDVIMTSGEHLKELVDDILDLSAAEMGDLKLSCDLLDVRQVVDDVLRAEGAAAANKLLELKASGEPEMMVWGDARRLRQVLTNILSNAVKATSSGGVFVQLAGAQDEDFAEIVVRDTGYGIPPDVLRTIFEPYRQAGDEISRRGGAGLGLAIARRLVILHGGSIQAASTQGQGSVFRLFLPRSEAVAQAAKEKARASNALQEVEVSL